MVAPAATGSSTGPSHSRRYSTSTVTEDGSVVPWLAATGPLSYCPERPPARDYFFQYTWVVPDLFAPQTNRRRHHVFGAPYKQDARELLAFWRHARSSPVRSVAGNLGRITDDAIAAPVAVRPLATPRTSISGD